MLLKDFVSARARVAGVMGVVLAGVGGAWGVSAEGITLLSASFEGPFINPEDIPEVPTEQDFIRIDIDQWDETGPDKFFSEELQGTIDNGVFINIDFPTSAGVIPAAGGVAEGTQVAFMVVDSTAGVTEPANTISQASSEVFEAGYSYKFTIGIGSSLRASPNSLRPGGDTANPETLELIIGYGDPLDITPVVEPFEVKATDLTVDFSTFQVPLVNFSVETGVLDAGDAALGEQIRVMVRQKAGAGVGGAFNLDVAQLERTFVPEPASLAVLTVGGLVLSRRRR